jgi:hypothetical protein
MRASYELFVDGELIEVLLATWIARLNKLEIWLNRANRCAPLYEELLNVRNIANQAHTELTTLNIYKKRNPAMSSKVQQQLQIASDNNRIANSLYLQLLNDMSD